MKMKPASFLLALALISGGCTRLYDPGFDRMKLAADVEKNATLRLADYAPFEWDRVHIFAPYTPASVVAAEVGTRVSFPHVNSEDYCLLVFLDRGKIVAALEIERKPADFAQLFRKGGYAKEDAIFEIAIRPADGWRILQSKKESRTSVTLPSGGSRL